MKSSNVDQRGNMAKHHRSHRPHQNHSQVWAPKHSANYSLHPKKHFQHPKESTRYRPRQCYELYTASGLEMKLSMTVLLDIGLIGAAMNTSPRAAQMCSLIETQAMLLAKLEALVGHLNESASIHALSASRCEQNKTPESISRDIFQCMDTLQTNTRYYPEPWLIGTTTKVIDNCSRRTTQELTHIALQKRR